MYHLAIIVLLVSVAEAKNGSCFDFPGDTYLQFRPSNLDISDNVHYSLQFQTTAADGIVMYAEGPDDYEALFLSGGQLIYLLANPSPSGVEGTSGGVYVSEQKVNKGTWVAVDLWRNWESKTPRPTDRKMKTGMQIRDRISDIVETHVDDLNHRDIQLNSTVYVGGISSSLIHPQGSSIPQFVGKIKEISEERNGITFDTYSLNFGGKVKSCS